MLNWHAASQGKTVGNSESPCCVQNVSLTTADIVQNTAAAGSGRIVSTVIHKLPCLLQAAKLPGMQQAM